MHRPRARLTRVVMAAGVAAFALSSLQCEQLLGLDRLYECPQDPRCPDGGTGGGEPASECTDGKKNGDETGKDCGGPCGPCPDGEGCKNGSDCESKSCSNGGTCAAPTCGDMVKNGDETDVDCGGMTCGPCAFGKGCAVDGDCATGYCNGKTCDARTIVAALTNPNSLVVDSKNVYWADADEHAVMMADIATGTPSPIASGLNDPWRLVGQAGAPSDLNPSLLFWVEPSAGKMTSASVGSMPTPGSSILGGIPQSVTVDGAYWTSQGPPSHPLGNIMTRDLGSPNTGVPLVSIDGQPDRIASAGAQALAFSESNGSLWVTPSYFNGTPQMLVPSTSAAGLAADMTYAYWSDGMMPGTVAKVPLTGGQPIVLASEQAAPTDVAVDTFNVYWINRGASTGAGAVMKAPLGGGKPIVLASGQDEPRGLFLTPNEACWISGAKGQGAIKKLPK